MSTILPLVGIPTATSFMQSMPDQPVYRTMGTYTSALAAAGAAPIMIPLRLPEPALREIFAHLDGLCLSGGGDIHPGCYGQESGGLSHFIDEARDDAELTLVRWALDADLPLLGICRGIQAINVATGGSLYQDIPTERPASVRHSYIAPETPRASAVHRVQVAAGSALAVALGTVSLRTNSFHHQAVNRIGAGFAPVAWAEDGLVEGLEAAGQRFALAVQWHPEDMLTANAEARQLFAAFVAACRSSGHGEGGG